MWIYEESILLLKVCRFQDAESFRVKIHRPYVIYDPFKECDLSIDFFTKTDRFFFVNSLLAN